MKPLHFGSSNTCSDPVQSFSAERYRDFSQNLDMPVDSDMPLDVRYELYISKIVYLKNMINQCFQEINSPRKGLEATFQAKDLIHLQQAFAITRDLVRECILRRVQVGLSRHAQRFPLNKTNQEE